MAYGTELSYTGVAALACISLPGTLNLVDRHWQACSRHWQNNLLSGKLSTASDGRWRSPFYIGGATCGDNEGFGNGPMEYMLCQDGKAWFCRWYCWFGYIIDQSPDLRKRRLLQCTLTRDLYGERPACCEANRHSNLFTELEILWSSA